MVIKLGYFTNIFFKINSACYFKENSLVFVATGKVRAYK